MTGTTITLSLIVLILALLGCGRHEPSRSQPALSLQAKAELYSHLVTQVQDENGFVDTYQCNAVQRSALLGASGFGRHVRLRSAFDPSVPGRMYRRPTSYPECFANGESRSTVSPDEFLGAFHLIWRNRDLALAEEIWDYGQRRGWTMGDDRIGGAHTLMKPRQVSLLASLIKRLGGRDHNERHYHAPSYGQCEGFECALQIYEVTLRGEIEGSLTNAERGALKQAADRQKSNPLAQAAWHLYSDGDQSEATRLLMELPRYPNDRLPSSQDVCDPWPVQRDDDSSSLNPCQEEKRVHSGGDWLFTYSLIASQRGIKWQQL